MWLTIRHSTTIWFDRGKVMKPRLIVYCTINSCFDFLRSDMLSANLWYDVAQHATLFVAARAILLKQATFCSPNELPILHRCVIPLSPFFLTLCGHANPAKFDTDEAPWRNVCRFCLMVLPLAKVYAFARINPMCATDLRSF